MITLTKLIIKYLAILSLYKNETKKLYFYAIFEGGGVENIRMIANFCIEKCKISLI